MDDRDLAKYYAGGRVVIGVLFLVMPGRMLKGILGGDRPGPGIKLLGRIIGVRDALLGAGALAALQDGDAARIRPWMTYGAVADGVDAFSTLFAYRQLPHWKRFGMLVMGISGSAAGGYLTAKFDQ